MLRVWRTQCLHLIWNTWAHAAVAYAQMAINLAVLRGLGECSACRVLGASPGARYGVRATVTSPTVPAAVGVGFRVFYATRSTCLRAAVVLSFHDGFCSLFCCRAPLPPPPN